MKHYRLVYLVLVVSLFVYACAQNPSPGQTPQASIAHYGTDIVNGVGLFQDLIIRSSTGPKPIMTTAQAKPYMDKILVVAGEGQKLSAALKEYDALTAGVARQAKAQQIQTILTAIAASGVSAWADNLPSSVATEGAKLVSNITTAIAQVKAALAGSTL